MLAIRYRWKGKCPKHPNYDPVKHGEGAIKGSCPTCTLLFRVYEAHRMTEQIARSYDEIASEGETLPMIRKIAGIVVDQERRIQDEEARIDRSRLRSAS